MRHATPRTAAAAALIVPIGHFLPGCARTEPQTTPPDRPAAAWFEEVAISRGLDFTHQSGHRERYLMPEIMCGGAALFDMDGDGDLDAYVVQAGYVVEPAEQQPPNQLFENLGDGTFKDVTAGSGADDRGYGMGVACGDYDNDGDVDLYVTNVGPNVLLRNDGHGRFTDVTGAAGVGDAGWGASAAFVDYDNDGDLDLYVCNYLRWSPETERHCRDPFGRPTYCSPNAYAAPAMDVLYRNEGSPGAPAFTNVTKQAGIDAGFGNGLGVICGDFNADGWIDIFVANDGTADQLWLNQADPGAPGFVDIAVSSGCAFDHDGRAAAGMGVTAADIDDDGDLDLLVCNLSNESDSFFRNDGRFFTNGAPAAGLGAISRRYTRFGLAWIDFDNDGLLDLYEVNGRVSGMQSLHSVDDFAEPNLLYRGVRGAAGPRFEELLPRGGTAEPLIATSRAAAFGDIDNDGGIDVLVVNRDERAHLLLNTAPRRGHWISFRVLDDNGRDAFGATLRFRMNDRQITRDVRAAYSYQASNDPRIHVGLGEASQVEGVVVQWVDGTREAFGDFPADQFVTLKRGGG